MNEIFGIDPNSPADIKDLKYMLDLFGLSNGRFIASYPHDWENLLRSKFNQLGDLDRTRVNRLLEIHKDATLKIDGDYRRSKNWIDNAVELQQTKKKFSKLFSVEGNPYKVPTLQSLLWNDNGYISDGRGAHIPMTVQSYCDAARPLFAFSSEVHLIDPYFSLRRENGDRDHRRWKVLSGFFSEAKKSERCDSFCIHLSEQRFPSLSLIDKFVEDIEQIRQEVAFETLNLTYLIDDEKIHGRYLFSVKGGLQFDHGFDTDLRTRNHVHWLSSNELEPLLNTF